MLSHYIRTNLFLIASNKSRIVQCYTHNVALRRSGFVYDENWIEHDNIYIRRLNATVNIPIQNIHNHNMLNELVTKQHSTRSNPVIYHVFNEHFFPSPDQYSLLKLALHDKQNSNRLTLFNA